EGGTVPAPHELLRRVNEELCQDNPHSMFATVFLATIDLASRELHYCNAGHPLPYAIGPAGVSLLEAPRGRPVGILAASRYAAAVRQLATGDGLFLFTDGVTEALDANGDLFAATRLEDVLRSVAVASPRSVVTAVVDAVRGFAGGEPQSDDIAALAVRVEWDC
ncbi:MAG: serine/threonine-protein phosphatase, partial [Burkholderiales bacterium]|nr:serine/threonine-protein phosphatase [Burkholderiales bacterium]